LELTTEGAATTIAATTSAEVTVEDEQTTTEEPVAPTTEGSEAETTIAATTEETTTTTYEPTTTTSTTASTTSTTETTTTTYEPTTTTTETTTTTYEPTTTTSTTETTTSTTSTTYEPTTTTTTEATTSTSTISTTPTTTTASTTTAAALTRSTCYQKQADITFLVDASITSSSDQYTRTNAIVDDVINAFSLAPEYTAISIIAYSDANEKRVTLADNDVDAATAIAGLTDRSSLENDGPHTGKNLGQAYLHVNFNKRNVPQILVVLTSDASVDGLMLNGWDMTTYDELLNLNIKTFGIGIGSLADEDELERMASTPHDETVFNTDNFVGYGLEDSLIDSICSGL